MGKIATRVPMPVRLRAKQFAMFDAMKGLTEAIAEKEREYCLKRELTESRKEEINRQLSTLQIGDSIQVKYYCQYAKQCYQRNGVLRRDDAFWKEIQVDDVVISFGEIYDIS